LAKLGNELATFLSEKSPRKSSEQVVLVDEHQFKSNSTNFFTAIGFSACQPRKTGVTKERNKQFQFSTGNFWRWNFFLSDAAALNRRSENWQTGFAGKKLWMEMN
jgi:hypothetical protein